MLLGTINLLPGVRYRLLIALWTNFVFTCQLVEWVLIFANPVFKTSGIYAPCGFAEAAGTDLCKGKVEEIADVELDYAGTPHTVSANEVK